MDKKKFIKKIQQYGFQYKKPVVAGDEFYDKICDDYKIRVEIWGFVVVYAVFWKQIEIFRSKQFDFSEQAISILKNLLIGFDDKNDSENITGYCQNNEFEELKEDEE